MAPRSTSSRLSTAPDRPVHAIRPHDNVCPGYIELAEFESLLGRDAGAITDGRLARETEALFGTNRRIGQWRSRAL